MCFSSLSLPFSSPSLFAFSFLPLRFFSFFHFFLCSRRRSTRMSVTVLVSALPTTRPLDGWLNTLEAVPSSPPLHLLRSIDISHVFSQLFLPVVPGFGSNMLWSIKHKVALIAFGNITYCALNDNNRTALNLLLSTPPIVCCLLPLDCFCSLSPSSFLMPPFFPIAWFSFSSLGQAISPQIGAVRIGRGCEKARLRPISLGQG